jgi:hypothetical protein
VPQGKKSVVVDALLIENPKFANLSSDSARLSYVVALGRGKFQDPEGVFNSHKHLAACLGRFARYIPELMEAGFIDSDGGKLRIHDWNFWQQVASTGRVQKFRRLRAVREETQ